MYWIYLHQLNTSILTQTERKKNKIHFIVKGLLSSERNNTQHILRKFHRKSNINLVKVFSLILRCYHLSFHMDKMGGKVLHES